MRILHVITSLKTGGAEHLLVDLIPTLKQQGCNVEVLVFDGESTSFMQDLQNKGVTIYKLHERGGVYNPLNIFRLLKYIGKYDIIHTHLSICQLYVPIAKMIKFSKTRLITTEHSTNNRRRGKWYLRIIDKWMYSKYNKVICISPTTRFNLEKQIGKKNNLIDIPNGVNVRAYLGPIKMVSNKDTFVITMVARFFEAKDQDTLVRAIKILPNRYVLKFVGDGPRKMEIENMVRELQIEDRVSFLGVRNDVPEILSSSDIVVLSSHWEGMSLSCIEGMASGNPFIASDVDGLREIVEGYGCLFPHEDYEALAVLIKKICENPDLYYRIAEKCQSHAKDFDISIMAHKYKQLYNSFCKI